jgi:hypothetical protein
MRGCKKLTTKNNNYGCYGINIGSNTVRLINDAVREPRQNIYGNLFFCRLKYYTFKIRRCFS